MLKRIRAQARRVEAVVLRRTAKILARYLPPLTTLVVFCRPSPLQARARQRGAAPPMPSSHFPPCTCASCADAGAQVELYQALLQSKAVSALLSGGSESSAGGGVLGVITALRKLCALLALCFLRSLVSTASHLTLKPNPPCCPAHCRAVSRSQTCFALAARPCRQRPDQNQVRKLLSCTT